MTKWFARNHKLAVFFLVEGVIEIVLYLNIRKGPNLLGAIRWHYHLILRLLIGQPRPRLG